MIGMIDCGCLGRSVTPSLELKKLSTYFKRRERIVTLITDLSNLDVLEPFTDVFVWDDGIVGNEFPQELLTMEKMVFNGLRFQGGVYNPLPLEVERLPPDNYLHEPFLKEQMSNMILGRATGERLIAENLIRATGNGKLIDPELNNLTARGTGHVTLVDDPFLFYCEEWRRVMEFLQGYERRIMISRQQFCPTREVAFDIVNANYALDHKITAENAFGGVLLEIDPEDIDEGVISLLERHSLFALSLIPKNRRFSQLQKGKRKQMLIIDLINITSKVCELRAQNKKIRVGVPIRPFQYVPNDVLGVARGINTFFTFNQYNNKSIMDSIAKTGPTRELANEIVTQWGTDVSRLFNSPLKSLINRGWRCNYIDT